MLSYQHGYHAGNMADVHKHALLAVALDYLTQKDKPFSYIETHAGRGIYDLAAPESQTTGEAEKGIAVAVAKRWFSPDHPYARVLAEVQRRFGSTFYPGSPLVAQLLLRPDDVSHLAELHPQEFAALTETMLPFAAHCRKVDGLSLAMAVTPPEPRRGLMLIDPSYEIKADYEGLPKLMYDIHRKWNVGIIALWYPVLGDMRHRPLLAALEGVNFPKVLRHEVRFAPARQGHGLIGSGMFIVNSPFGLETEAVRLGKKFASL